jgi:hypothetical protein
MGSCLKQARQDRAALWGNPKTRSLELLLHFRIAYHLLI